VFLMKVSQPFLNCHHAVPSSHTEADVASRRLHVWTRPEGSHREVDVAFSGSEWLRKMEALALFSVAKAAIAGRRNQDSERHSCQPIALYDKIET